MCVCSHGFGSILVWGPALIPREEIKIKIILVLLLLLQLSALAFSDDGSSCVDNYLDFDSFHDFLKALFTPVLLATVSLSLKRFISVWMHWSPGGEEGGNTAYPLHGHTYDCIHRCELPTINRYYLTDNHYMLTEIIHK